MSLRPDSRVCPAAFPWQPFLAAVPAVIVGTVLLCQTIEMVLTVRLLDRAAQAAALEATLPMADAASIQATVARVLAGSDLQDCIERPIIWIDGQPASADDLSHQTSSVAVTVSLSAYVTDVVPDLLKPLGMSLAGRRLTAHQVCVKP